jgi:hypothetical protein
MKTKGMFKKIAAVTLAALTVVTSSGVDYNLLSANAAETTGQVTDASTTVTLQKKDTKVDASTKISFSTNAALKQAVEDGIYTVDVRTNKVKVASIKYNKSLLEMGTDFTASAKRTSVKKVDGKYNYVFTVTITGKGKYTGSAKKTGVTMVSTVKPATTKKKTVKKADDTTTGFDWSSSSGLIASDKTNMDLSTNTVVELKQQYDGSMPYVEFTSRDENNVGFSITFRYAYLNKVKKGNEIYNEVAYIKNSNNTNTQYQSITFTYNSDSNSPKDVTNDVIFNKSDDYVTVSYKTIVTVKYRLVQDISNYNVTFDGTVADAYSPEYTSTKINPSVEVKSTDGTETLVKNTDYLVDISDENNYAAETEHTVTITGIGKYSSNNPITKTFKINPKDAVTSDGKLNTNYFKISGLDSTYTGSALTPTPKIVYYPKDSKGNALKDSDGNEITETLDSGDFSIDTSYGTDGYKNNINLTTENSLASVKIVFKGNYSGTLERTFNITSGKINAKGTNIYINGSTTPAVTIDKNQGTESSTTVDATKFDIDYSPVNTEIPTFKVETADGTVLTKDTDYTVGEITPVSTGTTSTTGEYKPTWPNIGIYSVDLTAKGNYSGTITVKFEVTQLDISSTKLTVTDKGFSNGTPYVIFSYTNKVGDNTYKEDKIQGENGKNFTVTKTDKSNYANENASLTITGKGNYKGTRIETAAYGLNLADAQETNDDKADCDIRIRSFDPFTGQELTGTSVKSKTALPYYGDDIYPYYSVEVRAKNSNGTYNWTPVSADKYTLTYLGKQTDQTPQTGNLYVGEVELSSKSNNDKTYNKIDLYFEAVPHSLSTIEDKESSSNYGKATGELSDDFYVNTQAVSSNINIDNIKNGLKLYLKPGNAGKFIAVVKKNNSTEIDILDSDPTGKYKNDKNTLVYWTAPTLSSDGKQLTLGTDYNVAFPTDKNGQAVNNGTVNINGIGNFKDTVTIKLNQENIGNEDFYVTYNSKEVTDDELTPDISYDGNSHWPSVELYKKALSGLKSPKKLTEGADYVVIYQNSNGVLSDENGYKLIASGSNYYYVASDGTTKVADIRSHKVDKNGNYYLDKDGKKIADKDGYKVNDNGEHLNKDNNTTTDESEYELLPDSKYETVSESDFTKCAKEDFNQVGTYTITLKGISAIVTSNDSKGSVTTISNYSGTRTVTYSIVGSSSKLSAHFNHNATTKYNYKNTAKPDFAYDSGDDTSNALSLIVKAGGNKLTKDKDYTAEPEDKSANYLTEPGVKTYIITGINEYKGQSTTASYTVTADMSELSTDTLLQSTPSISGDNRNKTLYYDGGQALKDKNGKYFSPFDINIKTEGNTPLDEGTDYSIDIDNGYTDVSKLYSAGNHTVTFTGNGVYKGTYSIYLNVVVTRANLLWKTDSSAQGGSDINLILPYRSSGYTLGKNEMSLHKIVGTIDETVELTGDDKISTDGGTTYKKYSELGSFKDVGSYKVTIKGPLESNDSTTLTFTILYNLSDAKIDLGKNATSFPYTGKDVYDNNGTVDLSQIMVSVDGKTLTYNTDYSISRAYSDNSSTNDFSNAGTITVSLGEVTGKSKYFSDNKPTVSYTITRLQENDQYSITGTLDKFVYNGKSQTPSDDKFEGKVMYGSTVLVKDKDYTVTFDTDSVNAGSKTIIVTGIGNYSGSRTIANAYIINQKDLSELQKSDITIPDQYYTGDEITPKTLKVKDVEGNLVYGKDFTITNAKNNTNTGTATVTVNGIGTNFTGSADNVTFEIVKLTLTADNFEVTNATYNKGGSIGVDQHIRLFIPDGKGGDGKIYLKRGTDYTLVFTKGTSTTAVDPTDAGTYDVQVSPMATSDYVTGSPVTLKFTVDPLNIEDVANEFEVANANWTGNAVTPRITLNGKALDSTYSVSWENNIDACAKTRAEMLQYDPNFDENKIPTAVITGKGNYTGTIRKTFQIGSPFSDATITPATNTRLTYNGTPQTQEFIVKYADGNGEIKTLDTSRYTVKYPDNTTDAGDKTVLFTANGGPLYGTKTTTYTIYPVSGTTWTLEFTKLTMDSTGQYTVQYQGAAITPEVKAYELKAGGNRTEIPLKSGEITYNNNTAAGTASVTVNPNNYEGTKTLYFKILGVDISGDDVYAAFADGITRRQYTGSAITPAVTVTFAGNLGTVTLRKDVDYSLTYENNTNAGAASVKVTGIGNYSGSKTLSFDIFANLNDKTSVFTIPKQMYTGEPITELSGATIKAGGNNLVLGTDYTLSITSTDSFRTKGTAIFTAESKYYEGTRTVQFEIGNDASMYNVLGVSSTYVYDRSAHKPVPVVTDKQGTVYSVDSVTYASTSDGDTCINAGNVKMQIVITSHGQSVTIPYNYTIEPKNINTASITPIADVDYNGKAHTPTIRITDGTNLLTGSPTSSNGSADYTYTYFNNTQPGTATVSIQGINNYTGVANIYFAINVKAAPQMIVTAMPSGRLKVTWNKVSGVSGYRIFYSSASGTQKQTILSSSKKSTYITGLTRGVVYTVGLQSFITANGQNGYSSASVQQIATSTAKPTITSAKSTGKGKIKITWKKVSNATAYMVYRKTAGSSKWTRVKTTKSTSFTNTGLKSGKKYTYKVISYKQSGVKRSFSKYSTGKTVKAK